MLVNLSTDSTSTNSTTNIQNLMNALQVPSNPEAIQNVARQLAITDQPPSDQPPSDQPPSDQPPLPPPLVSPSPTTALALVKAKSPPRVPPRKPIKEQGKASAAENQKQLTKAKSVLNAATKVDAVRKQPPPKPSPSRKGQIDLSKPPGLGPLSPYVASNDEQNLYIMQQRGSGGASSSATPPTQDVATSTARNMAELTLKHVAPDRKTKKKPTRDGRSLSPE